ncbi:MULTISPECIES: HU family DNA-binding protein [Bacteroides]|uniref:HU family DNA-binding protein n=1 Tax=Bacteroides TaxID=816 RepID=UPI000E44A409|nr:MULTISPECIES: HU family DNA-binding protein [Bacteroides]MBS7574310.1 HU family DNA-binding protein [Bacteroides propionicigenes]RGM25281.1 peptidoglycan-binding protein LysM [Bacteroides sp. OM08-17BH]RHJ50847.1 peptidoglycan-binding protein LysM [Bacteroides sp. AM10-21B]HBO05976.1 peptidoglycan-binding protein LysM [Bacteroides sp.]
MNEKLNIQDLIDLLAEKHGMSKKNADSFVKEFFQLIEEALEKDKYVKIKGLGAFKLIDVESRESINVNTGERFEIQGHTKVSFTPEPALKDIINKPFSHFETVVLNDDTVLEDTPIDNGNEDEEETEQRTEECVPGVTEKSQDVTEAAVDTSEEAVTLEEMEIRSEEVTVCPGEEIAETPSVVSEETAGAEETEVVKTEVPAESSTMKYFIGIVVLVVLLCSGAVVYLYYPDLFDKLSTKPPVEEIVDAKVNKQTDNKVLTDSISVKDTTAVAKADTAVPKKPVDKPVIKKPDATVVAKQPVVVAASASQSPKQSGAAYIPDSTNYTIVGTEATYTIQPGETLTKVALRFYGTKALYPYIVKHNPNVIKKPNNVPAGTTIKIPKLAKKQ